ncbi:hypothetical protein L227DRAFT_607059 [Lentinus tigrinus ALCF2SS1-6]|uniref:Uncharacterized protein n=1 Tax=Lentinus tigrinus ALCF2SS1-6 TaxID=1328759 RepID=A0A5C2SR76_9APHY|nr:hypothetical protein L227DRAFT_607059 [Lentinus tigrinus ALCF2SS1-6]
MLVDAIHSGQSGAPPRVHPSENQTGKSIAADQETLQLWKAAKSAFLKAGVDLAKYGSFWPQVGQLTQRHVEASVDLLLLTLRIMDMEGPGMLRLLPIELPDIPAHESFMQAQAFQQNIEQLKFQRQAIDIILEILNREADLLREKYAPKFED